VFGERGIDILNGCVDELSGELTKELIPDLLEFEKRTLTVATLARNSRVLETEQQGWPMSLVWAAEDLSGEDYFNFHNFTRERFELRRFALLRLLRTKLALHCYYLEHGRFPPALTEVVPEYLEAVPSDPFGDGPLVYRPRGDGYDLYSVGPDGDDDGGVIAESNVDPVSDLRLEEFEFRRRQYAEAVKPAGAGASSSGM
jgi:hypothetical protein